MESLFVVFSCDLCIERGGEHRNGYARFFVGHIYSDNSRVLVLARHACTSTEGPNRTRCLAAVWIVFFHRHAQFPHIHTIDVLRDDVGLETRFGARTAAAVAGIIGPDALSHIPLSPRDVCAHGRRARSAMAAIFKKATAGTGSYFSAVSADLRLLLRVSSSRRGPQLRGGVVSVFDTRRNVVASLWRIQRPKRERVCSFR